MGGISSTSQILRISAAVHSAFPFSFLLKEHGHMPMPLAKALWVRKRERISPRSSGYFKELTSFLSVEISQLVTIIGPFTHVVNRGFEISPSFIKIFQKIVDFAQFLWYDLDTTKGGDSNGRTKGYYISTSAGGFDRFGKEAG
jgi:hypothetical protein